MTQEIKEIAIRTDSEVVSGLKTLISRGYRIEGTVKLNASLIVLVSREAAYTASSPYADTLENNQINQL